MKLTVVFKDKLIVKDGIGYGVDSIPSVAGHEGAISVLWDETKGEVDFGNGDLPTAITNESVLAPYVQAWQVGKAKQEAKETQIEAAQYALYHSPEAVTRRVKKERNKRLSATDYIFEPDYPELTAQCLAEFKTYRKALRDLPQKAGFPWTDSTVPWPTEPSIVFKEAN